MESFAQINWLATLVGAVIAYIVGGIWFHPKVFGGSWMKALGKTQEEPVPAGVHYDLWLGPAPFIT